MLNLIVKTEKYFVTFPKQTNVNIFYTTQKIIIQGQKIVKIKS